MAVLVLRSTILAFSWAPCVSRRLRALPTVLRVRLYVSEAAEGGVVGATVPARALSTAQMVNLRRAPEPAA